MRRSCHLLRHFFGLRRVDLVERQAEALRACKVNQSPGHIGRDCLSTLVMGHVPLSHADTYGKGRLSHPESLANDRNWLHEANSATSYRPSSIVALVAPVNSVAILLL